MHEGGDAKHTASANKRERTKTWHQFLKAERKHLENRGRGQLARLIGGALPEESEQELAHLAREDQRRAEEGLVELKRGNEVYYKHIDDLVPEDRFAIAEAERARINWLISRHRRSPVGEDNLSTLRLLEVERTSYPEQEYATPSPTMGATMPITNRQREIMLMVARGMSNRQIARTLHIAEATVKRHLADVNLQLETHSRSEAVREMLSRGWLSFEEIMQDDEGGHQG